MLNAFCVTGFRKGSSTRLATMVSGCLERVHSTPGRWRYRMRTATSPDWSALEQQLARLLDPALWGWRCNRLGGSLVLWRQPRAVLELSDAEFQQLGLAALETALQRCGMQPPSPELIRVRVRPLRQPDQSLPSLPAWLLRPLNLTNLLVSLGLMVLAFWLVLLAAAGLLLPLWPAGTLLLLAWWLVELAFRLRRPFVLAAFS